MEFLRRPARRFITSLRVSSLVSSGPVTVVRRTAALMLIAVGIAICAAPLVYRTTFGKFPPTRINLLLWLTPEGDACLERAINTELAPLGGSGLGVGDICPYSKYGPADHDSVFDGVAISILLLVGASAGLAWIVWPRRRTMEEVASDEQHATRG
jgi:hypothetical protein